MPLIRVITDGGAGMRAQALGLARAVAALGGGEGAEITESFAVAPKIANILPLSIAAGMCRVDGGRADIVVGCGVRAQPALLAAKKRLGAFAVCLQKPRRAEWFDAVVAPRHDYSAAAVAKIESQTNGNTVLILGSVGNAAASPSAPDAFSHIPAPKTGVLIGGDNRACRFSPEFCRELAAQILAADASGGVLASASRRTGQQNVAVLADMFSAARCFFYPGEGAKNPYPDILAAADRFVVTGDSVNMLSEACAAGKPVYIVLPPQKSARAAAKFRRFHEELAARNLARFWRGEFAEWTPPGWNETARAAEFVWARYRAARRC